jgi:hypothetical protein
MIAGDMQAMTDVPEMAQKLMNSFEDAMAIMDHADTDSAAYIYTEWGPSRRVGAASKGQLGN